MRGRLARAQKAGVLLCKSLVVVVFFDSVCCFNLYFNVLSKDEKWKYKDGRMRSNSRQIEAAAVETIDTLPESSVSQE